MKRFILIWLCFACTTARSAETVGHLRTPNPTTCTPISSAPDRFDPALQRLLVVQQLQALPVSWQAIYFYLPAVNDGELKELQIHYLEELLARARAKSVQN